MIFVMIVSGTCSSWQFHEFFSFSKNKNEMNLMSSLLTNKTHSNEFTLVLGDGD